MAKRRKKPSPPDDGVPDPKLVGAGWRALMTEESESLPSLVWRRVFAKFRIDLADPRQATDMQIYRLLHELMQLCVLPDDGDDPGVNVSVVELETFLDPAVGRVFRRK